jgi:hypothetical protein
VWNKNWFVIILPTSLCVANFGVFHLPSPHSQEISHVLTGSSIWLIISLLQFNPDGESVFQNNVIKSTNAFIALTLCTNLICTGSHFPSQLSDLIDRFTTPRPHLFLYFPCPSPSGWDSRWLGSLGQHENHFYHRGVGSVSCFNSLPILTC